MRNALRTVALLATLGLAAATVLALPAPEKMQTASGNVSQLQAASRAVVVKVTDGADTRFVWTDETKINGTLAIGARVTVRYTILPDGQNVAHQISVTKS